MSRKTTGLIFAVITAVCWAILAIMLKHAVTLVHPSSIAWFRLLAAGLMLVGYFAIRKPGKLVILKKPPLAIVAAGLFLAFNYYGFTRGLELTSASHAQVMIQTGPWILILLGIFWFKEHLNWVQWGGLGLALIGFVLFYLDQLEFSHDNLANYWLGTMWLAGAALTWAIYAGLQKSYFNRYSPAQLNTLLYLSAAAGLVFFTDFKDFAPLNLNGWILLSLLALNTLVAYGSFSEALSRIPAYQVSLIIAVNPLLTILIIQLNTLFHFSWIPTEPLDLLGWAGSLMVAGGVGVAVSQKS